MLGNGTTDIQSDLPDADVDGPLQIRNHPDVKRLQTELQKKRGELDELRRKRREESARRQELEEKFEESLDPESDLDPAQVRDERLQLEEELDQFQERRLVLQSEIAGLEQKLNAKAEEAREEISGRVDEPLRELHATFARHLQEAVRAHLALRKMDALKRTTQFVPGLGTSERVKHRPDLPLTPQFDFPNGLRHAQKILQSLRNDGFDIDEDLLTRLKKDHV